MSSYLCSMFQGGLFWSLAESKRAVHGFARIPSTQAASAGSWAETWVLRADGHSVCLCAEFLPSVVGQADLRGSKLVFNCQCV